VNSSGPWWMWVVFFIVILFLFSIDFFLSGRKVHVVSTQEALMWVSIWMLAAFLFNFIFWVYLKTFYPIAIANQKALEFLAGYVIEQSLSVDNMFTFVLIFSYFTVPLEYQRRVLLYGVLSAIILRLVLICAGAWLIAKVHWILYLFGVFLVFTGIKMFFFESKQNLAHNPLLRLIKKHIRITDHFHREYFFVRLNKLWYATPLLVVLIFIECSDLIFALDSIPAIFAITNDIFIVFTSNIFAILGLRALYFLLMNMSERFYLLKYGIALLLTFIGVKMLIKPWIHIPIALALSAIIAILGTAIILSLVVPKREPL